MEQHRTAFKVLFIVTAFLAFGLFSVAFSADNNLKGLKVEGVSVSKLNEKVQTLETGMEYVQPISSGFGPSITAVKSAMQGGEDIASATPITTLPYSDVGTTLGYADDYDEACVAAPGASPDVVYSYTPTEDEKIDISLCESSYMTHMWVYENDASTVVACNRFNASFSGHLA